MERINTESKWLSSTKPNLMVRYVKVAITLRQSLLMRLAGCSHLRDQLVDERSRKALLVGERLAEGLATTEEARQAHEEAYQAYLDLHQRHYQQRDESVSLPMLEAASQVYHCAWLYGSPWEDAHTYFKQATKRLREKADIVRDVLGNPFRQIVFEPDWLLWNSGTVLKLATTIYQEQRFESLPVLADALEEAGCVDPTILQHCRAPGLHVRGCWLLDRILDKK